jgi:hypothetical protein
LFYNAGTGKKEDKMTLHELEQTIAKLPPAELSEFRQWFLRFDGDRWDEQIEKDATSGKLESLAQSALREFRSGQTNPL